MSFQGVEVDVQVSKELPSLREHVSRRARAIVEPVGALRQAARAGDSAAGRNCRAWAALLGARTLEFSHTHFVFWLAMRSAGYRDSKA